MTVHREWRDPLVIAQDHAATVRVVRSRTDPTWTRVEQPYGADGRWVAHQRRVGGLNAAIRGLTRIVIEQVARIAQLEHQRLEPTHPVCPTCHQDLMGIVGSCPDCDLDLALGPDDFVTAPAGHDEAAAQETTIAAYYNDDGYGADPAEGGGHIHAGLSAEKTAQLGPLSIVLSVTGRFTADDRCARFSTRYCKHMTLNL